MAVMAAMESGAEASVEDAVVGLVAGLVLAISVVFGVCGRPDGVNETAVRQGGGSKVEVTWVKCDGKLCGYAAS
jgi:hypothetical protein